MTPPPDVKLAQLLRALFTAEELHRFLRTHYRDVADELPVNVGIIPLASASAEALARRNLIDEALFTTLRAQRAHCTQQIELTDRAFRTDPSHALQRTPRLILFACALATAALATLNLVTAGSDESQCSTDRCGRDSPTITNALYTATPESTDPPTVCMEGMVRIDLANPPRSLCIDRTEVTRDAFCTSPTSRRNVLSKQDLDRCTPDPTIERWAYHPISMVRTDEAESFCRECGLRLPERHAFAQLLTEEIAGRTLTALLPAMNVCDADCYHNRGVTLPFTHHDGYGTTAPVGTYREKFSSPNGLDDIFGNVREIVLDGSQAYVCGSSYLHSRLDDLKPEHCLSPQNMPVVAGGTRNTVGFRCAGDLEPAATRPSSR